MTPNSFATRWNLDAIDAAYRRWRENPAAVDETWRFFCEGFDLAASTNGQFAAASGKATNDMARHASVQASVIRLIDAYRGLGHFQAHIDPLSNAPGPIPQLELSEFGLSDSDLDETVDASHFYGLGRGTLRQLVQALRETYCRTIGVEYMHIQDRQACAGCKERMEPGRNRPQFSRAVKLRHSS